MNATEHLSYGEAAPSNGGIAEPTIPDRATRTLRTIFAADIIGYSRHMAEAEADTVAALGRYRAVIDALIVAREGYRLIVPGPEASVVLDRAPTSLCARRS